MSLMLFDLVVRSCSRLCAKTGKAIQPGEAYFSVLAMQENGPETETIRHDYAAEAWQGPPEDCLGWWRSRVPLKDEKPKLAPAEVMLNLFIALADKPNETQFRYLLGLLLIRRRVLRREEVSRNETGQEVLALVAPRRDQRFEMIVDEPDAKQAEQIQLRMIDLLYGDGETQASASESNLKTDAA